MTNSNNGSRLWVLGASDPEMEMIEQILRETGEPYGYEIAWGSPKAEGGQKLVRVRPGQKGDRIEMVSPKDENWDCPINLTVFLVEASTEGIEKVRAEEDYDAELFLKKAGEAEFHVPYEWEYRVIDHHHPGDPGYGKSSAEFFAASSIGQVIAQLELLGVKVETRKEYTLAAAADHCLAAAYRGECPGVDPDELMRWRVASRAKFQNRSEEDLLADVERARIAVKAAPRVIAESAFLDISDMRPGQGAVCGVHGSECLGSQKGCWGDVPELPEAAAREGVAYLAISKPGRDGRRKIVLGAASPEQVQWFLEHFPAKHKYGVPARGFAGGYLE